MTTVRSLTHAQTALGVLAVAVTGVVIWQVIKKRGPASESSGDATHLDSNNAGTRSTDDSAAGASAGVKSEGLNTPKASSSSTPSSSAPNSTGEETTPLHSNARSQQIKDHLHVRIEEIDRRGKGLFKAKKFADAAEAFTEAIDLIEDRYGDGSETDISAGLSRQLITLMNNRSAMYEKGGMHDLSLADCDAILVRQPSHQKARNRRLRILESQNRYRDALVEVCALQLQFMQENRDKLRMGIPVTPPVSQHKIEELMGHILPNEIDKCLSKLNAETKERPLPSKHTILQLLQSFSGYSAWMAQAARSGSVSSLTADLDKFQGDTRDANAEKVGILLARGRRYAYDQNFEEASSDFEAAVSIVEDGGNDVIQRLDGDSHARLLEWAGTARHLRYNLDGALDCYEACSDLEPTNSELLVKRAGVKMDDGKLDDALQLFESALGMDPDAVDALLHRANLNMLRAKPAEAKADLNRLVELRPDHLLARLRLATVLVNEGNLDEAKRCLDIAENIDPNSSEVHSYRGELLFAQGNFADARVEFDKAIACESGNPTPYVNAALAVMNVASPTGGPPDVVDAINLLEKAIEVDPQFHAAYVHLGQLKLSLATDLQTASEVVALYDKGLQFCRTAEELKDIVSMRLLTLAQVEAARLLKMETLSMQ